MKLFGSISIFIVGLLLLLKPKLIWKFKHLWDVKDGEPTELYVFFSRCVGIFAILIGIILFVVYLDNTF